MKNLLFIILLLGGMVLILPWIFFGYIMSLFAVPFFLWLPLSTLSLMLYGIVIVLYFNKSK